MSYCAGTQVVGDPITKADLIAEKWGKIWGTDVCAVRKSQLEAVVQCIHRQRANPVECQLRSPTEIRASHKSFPRNTSVGADNWAFKDMAELPDEALVEYEEQMADARARAAPPFPALLQRMALIPKEEPGYFRGIGILATWYRNDGHPDDSAKPGASAGSAASERALNADLSITEGKCVISLRWDLTKFYDKVRATTVISKGLKHCYPWSALTMSVIVALAPRRLSQRSVISMAIQGIALSNIPGCPRAPSIARLTLKDGASAIRSAGTRLGEHIDDLTATIEGSTQQQAIIKAIEVGLTVQAQVDRIFAITSAKSVATATSKEAADSVAKTLQRYGIPIRS